MNGKNLNKTLQVFIRHIESINDTLPMVMLLIEPYQKKTDEELTKFINDNVGEIESDDGKKLYR